MKNRLLQQTGVQSDAWTELASKPHLENDELILTHTFLNAQMGPFADFTKSDSIKDLNDQTKLKWVDERQSQKHLLITNESKDDLIYKSSIEKVTAHHNKETQKSIIKVPFDRFFVENNCDTDEGEPIDNNEQKLIMDSKPDEEAVNVEIAKESTPIQSKSVDKDYKKNDPKSFSKPIIPEKFMKPFEYHTTDENDNK